MSNMEEQMNGKAFLIWLLFLVLAAHNVVTPVTSRTLVEFTDQKSYYPPAAGSSPKPAPVTKPDCPTPSHATPTPSSSHPTPTPPSHGGSYGTPTPPSHGTPPASSSHGGSIPTTPPVVTPPHSTPIVDPHLPPYFTGTCSYWGSHPDVIIAILGSWGDIGTFFGPICATIFGTNLSFPDALTNVRPDGYGALFREGAAALLNSMANTQFPFTAQQVQDAFAAALGSNGDAAAQAALFQRANEGRIKV